MDEFTACEQAFQRGYEKGLKAQYGETLTGLLRERDYYKIKLRNAENKIRRLENG